MGALEVWDPSLFSSAGAWVPLGVELPARLVPHGEYITTLRQTVGSGWTPREGWEEEPGSNANGAMLTGLGAATSWFMDQPGLYKFTAYDTFDGTTASGLRRAIRLVKNPPNGPEVIRDEVYYGDAATSADAGLSVSTRVWMDAMDSIEVQLWHNSNEPGGLAARNNAGFARFVFRRVLE